MNFLRSLRTAIAITHEVNAMEKAGASAVQLKRLYSVPVVRPSYWGFTMEACLLYVGKWKPVVDVFRSFDEKIQHALTFHPGSPKGFVERAKFWQSALKPALPSELYHEAMLKITHWYAHCVRNRLGMSA
ncbi:MAG: hypothetical protein HFE99_07435 [Ruminiclostridium sp.]|jgi:hypothetical protein|nr:hypothetical protein [Ruminiclostridium sp.]